MLWTAEVWAVEAGPLTLSRHARAAGEEAVLDRDEAGLLLAVPEQPAIHLRAVWVVELTVGRPGQPSAVADHPSCAAQITRYQQASVG